MALSRGAIRLFPVVSHCRISSVISAAYRVSLFPTVAACILVFPHVRGNKRRDEGSMSLGEQMKRLTAKLVDAINRPGKYHDGDAGLYLYVQEQKGRLRKSYVQRVTVHGRRVEIGLGSAKWTTPSEARAKAQANRKIARTGGDPRQGKATTVPTFEQAAETVIRMHAATWKDGAKTEKRWRAILTAYAFPKFGKRPVDKITSADLLAVLVPHWSTKRETMRKLRQQIGAIMKWAIAEGHRDDNPAGETLGAALPKGGAVREHQRALPYDAVHGALAAVRESGAWWATKAAFMFLVLTAARSGEVRGMEWSEVDFDAATWTCPAARMKSGRVHRVPLSGAALALLREARDVTGGEGLCFPSIMGKEMSDSTISKLLKENNVGAVPHGFRSSFRDFAAERTNIPREVCEEALAHVNPNQIEAAYRRSDLYAKRRDLMDAWARHIDTDTSSKVVSIR